jgi:flagellar basal-body rod modification protein FlgD
MSTVGLDNILATQSAADAASASKAQDKIAEQKNMFLTLLVKQLQYQDPLNPLENTEFTAQLAQFSQLESLSEMSRNIETMTKYQNSMNSMASASFIGKHVNATGNIINYNGKESTIDFNVEDNAAKVTVSIYNSEGTTVRTIDVANVKQGDVSCLWDGKNNNGETLSPGTYYFGVSATGFSGAAVNTHTYANGTVTGVTFDNGSIYLQVGDKEVSLADVSKITN